MLKETTLYTAICDRCEKEFHNQFESEYRLETELLLFKWHDTGELHFCPDCHSVDENNEVTIKQPIYETND